MSQSCWIIAGATSTIAMAFARLVAKRGDQLILLARDSGKLAAIQADLRTRYNANVSALFFDAEKTMGHQIIADQCMRMAKHPINLLLAFGVMAPGAAIDHTQEQMLSVINSNFTGVASATHAFLPYFRKQKRGHILVLGSVAGDRGRPSNFDYGASKAALIPFFEGLRAAVYADNVTITVMKMGYIDTPMIQGKPGAGIAASPDACAKACLKAAEKGAPQKYFPWFWRWIMLAFKLMPRFVLRKLNV